MSRQTRIALVFGGWKQAVWLICAFLLLVPGLAGRELHYDFLRFREHSETTRGFITYVEMKEYRSGYRGMSTSRFYEHHYVYDAFGQTIEGVSYANFERSGEVEVEYLYDEPKHSRIVGMSTKSGNGMVLFVTLLLFAGCVVWTVYRVRHLDRRATKFINRLVMLPPYRAVGFYPKFRLDRDERLIAKASGPLLVVPIAAVILTALSMLHLFG